MADLIIIRAQQQSGKTTTTGMIYQQLLNSCDTEHEFDNRIVSVDSLRFNRKGETMDFTAVLTLKSNKKRIGIVSEGDIADFVRNKLNFIIAKKVDVIICCARSVNREGSTYRMILDEYSIEHPIALEVFTQYSANINDKFTIKQNVVNRVVTTVLNLL